MSSNLGGPTGTSEVVSRGRVWIDAGQSFILALGFFVIVSACSEAAPEHSAADAIAGRAGVDDGRDSPEVIEFDGQAGVITAPQDEATGEAEVLAQAQPTPGFAPGRSVDEEATGRRSSLETSEVLAATGPSDRIVVSESLARKYAGDDMSVTQRVEKLQLSGGGVVQLTPPRQSELVQTFARYEQDALTLVSVIHEASAAALTFDFDLMPGYSFEPLGDGAFALVDHGVPVAILEKPWARDATGRELDTAYKLEGKQLIQSVNTEDATFPVVADPTVKAGFHYGPVVYIRFTWRETWRIKNIVDDSGAAAAGPAVCAVIPNVAARALCIPVVVHYFSDLKSTTDQAVRNNKCLALRLPGPGNVEGIASYDAYYRPCDN